jgi:hypothetical protein
MLLSSLTAICTVLCGVSFPHLTDLTSHKTSDLGCLHDSRESGSRNQYSCYLARTKVVQYYYFETTKVMGVTFCSNESNNY